MKFLRKSKKKVIKIEEIDITSLLDILVILLVFLLQSFSSSELTVNLVDELSLPYSWAQDYGQTGVTIQVNSMRKTWINNKEIGELSMDGKLNELLLRELQILAKKERNKINLRRKSTGNNTPLFINLVFDKELQYSDIHIVLNTATEAGFGKYKFIVQGTE